MGINVRLGLSDSVLTQPNQRAVFQLPSREIIYYVQGAITSRHIASKRPSYINGLLIHSRGQDSESMCEQCAEKRERGVLSPFLTCRRIKGVFHDCCSNCKWYDGASGCSLFTGTRKTRAKRRKVGNDGVGAGEGRDDERQVGDGSLMGAPELMLTQLFTVGETVGDGAD